MSRANEPCLLKEGYFTRSDILKCWLAISPFRPGGEDNKPSLRRGKEKEKADVNHHDWGRKARKYHGRSVVMSRTHTMLMMKRASC